MHYVHGYQIIILAIKRSFLISELLLFFLSPIADNLTTALILGTVVMVAGRGNKAFIVPGLINIVVAANAGGHFHPLVILQP